MSFYLPKIIWMLVDPLAILLAMLCLGLVLCLLRGTKRWGRRLVGLASVIIVFVSIVPVGQLLIAGLESRFPPVRRLPDKVDGVIALGGSVSLGLSELRGQPTTNNNSERITAFAELVRRYPDAKHVFSGGSGSLKAGYLREADIAAKILRGLGINTNEIIFEASSRNTYEHPREIRKLVAPKPEETWILITSAYHMPRAVGVFRAQNWPVLAYPTDYRTGGMRHTIGLGFTLPRGISTLSQGVHNWAGLIAYYLLGRTSEFLPGLEPEAS